MNNIQQIEKFFIKELSSNLKEVFIVKDPDGSYELFNRYKIQPQENGLFKIIPYSFTEEVTFSSLKNAFVWCIFNKNNRFTETKRIHKLDHLLNSIEISMSQQRKLLTKTKDPELKSIYMAKLHESRVKKSSMINELTTYINISKHLQYRKFLAKQAK